MLPFGLLFLHIILLTYYKPLKIHSMRSQKNIHNIKKIFVKILFVPCQTCIQQILLVS